MVRNLPLRKGGKRENMIDRRARWQVVVERCTGLEQRGGSSALGAVLEEGRREGQGWRLEDDVC